MTATSELQILFTAKDQASKTLSGIQGKLKDLQPTFKKMSLIGTAAFTGIMAAAGVCIKAFSEAKVEMAVATQSIKNSIAELDKSTLAKLTNEAGKGKTALQYVSEEMLKAGKAAIKLGFDDEEASKSYARLFSVSQDVAQAQKDLQLAMDLSAFSGQNLEDSAVAIARVYAGSTRELKAFGIEVEEGMTPMETLAALNKKVAGTADASKDSFKILAVQLQNVKESIGAALLPTLTDLLNKLQPVIEKTIAWIEANPELTKWIIIVGGAVAGLTAALGILGMALPGLITGFTMLWIAIGGPIGLLVIAIGALVVYWIKNWTMLKDNLLYIWTAIRDFAVEVWEGIKNAITSVIDAVVERVENFINKIKNIFEIIANLREKVKGAITGFVGNVGAFLGFQEGGVVPGAIGQPVPAIVHGGETIIPAGEMRSVKRYIVSPSNVVNIYGGYYLSENIAEQIGDLIIKRLKANIRV